MDGMAPRRTRVVDLGALSREEVIEVAKKQALSIREKSNRINALEELVEAITGNPAPDSLRSQEGAGSSSTTSDNRRELAIQEAMDEERLSYVQELSCYEEEMRKIKQQLEEKTQQHTALQSKVEEWKSKVMLSAQRDQETIAQLQQQLQDAKSSCISHEPLETTQQNATIPPDVLEVAVQSKLSVWKERIKTKMQQDMDRIESLEAQLNSLRANAASAMPAQSTKVYEDIANAPSPDKAFTHNQGNNEQTEQRIAEAVEERIQQWKDTMAETLRQDRETIHRLEQELQMLRTETGETQISLDAPAEVVSNLGYAAHQEVEQLHEHLTTIQNQHQATLTSFQHELEELRSQLKTAQRERETAVAAAGEHERSAAAVRDETATRMQQELEELRSQLETAQREREMAVAAAGEHERSAAAVRDETATRMQQELEELRSQLETAQRERETAVTAAEEHERSAAAVRDETATRMQQELEELRSQLEAAQRERDYFCSRNLLGNIMTEKEPCSECTIREARMDGWKKKVKSALERSDTEKKFLLGELALLREGSARADSEFSECVELLRRSLSKAQMETVSLIHDKQRLLATVEELQQFKTVVETRIAEAMSN